MAAVCDPHFHLFDASGDLVLYSAPRRTGVSAHEMYDGVPLVQLTDSVEDLQPLIEVLYNPRHAGTYEAILSSLFVQRWDPDMPLKLSSAMKLQTETRPPSRTDRAPRLRSPHWSPGATTAAKTSLPSGQTSAFRACIRHSSARDHGILTILLFAFSTLTAISNDKDWDNDAERCGHANATRRSYCALAPTINGPWQSTGCSPTVSCLSLTGMPTRGSRSPECSTTTMECERACRFMKRRDEEARSYTARLTWPARVALTRWDY
ncbi:uncharacterized protein PHACADRAFT_32407 [Phanerochaete carnosa HHB-10118-sp]|uniref:Uncharacterized protein n=1 Tax=Phanerochaete carnosa (strain HHB-10118-sp) TaxID=650164 RepID=K5WMD5_PHACS|nr:uncharacterized protein PHACADRAFT_32407 [Phanerochaete carnosa HHB-10118-sp]EKM51457.1 hypothetical protein PHACADRAFT_32407 [Phanerochaete carnosa HHB-10118-sp]